jgi:radical SAM superfamily enzyme YgiQ (UPF0313 family)
MNTELILINPWIYDFAAYDLWSKPLGLLYLAGILRDWGFSVHLIDCLDNHHPGMKGNRGLVKPVRRQFGTGKFWRQGIPKPLPLKGFPRSYSRYGISRELFAAELKGIKNPAAILITSLMTYWYPGVMEAVSMAKEIHPDTPVILGGIYARLCRQHAFQYSGADLVISDCGHPPQEELIKVLDRAGIGVKDTPVHSAGLSYPAFEMLHHIDYITLLTSTGCPFRCRYCASHYIVPRRSRRAPEEVLEEIFFWNRTFGVRDFAFYDDALLLDADVHISRILEPIAALKPDVRFHTPNALHIREISLDMARLLRSSGFQTIRLGYETADIERLHTLDSKVSEGEFERAVAHLKKAGFGDREIGVYVLAGLPDQSVASVLQTLNVVGNMGVMPYLAEYSPIPHTALWERAVECSEYDLAAEPLFHNNTLLPCWDEAKRNQFKEIRGLMKTLRRR